MQSRLAAGPSLITWALRCESLATACARVPDLGEILSMSRGDFRWKIAVPEDGSLPFSGVLPAGIQWEAGATGEPPASLRSPARQRMRPAGARPDRIRPRCWAQPASCRCSANCASIGPIELSPGPVRCRADPHSGGRGHIVMNSYGEDDQLQAERATPAGGWLRQHCWLVPRPARYRHRRPLTPRCPRQKLRAARRIPHLVEEPARRPCRRVLLDARRRSEGQAAGDHRAPRRPRTPTPRRCSPTSSRCRTTWSPRCARASRRTTVRCRCMTTATGTGGASMPVPSTR